MMSFVSFACFFEKLVSSCSRLFTAVNGPGEDKSAVGGISGKGEEKRRRRERKRAKYACLNLFNKYRWKLL